MKKRGWLICVLLLILNSVQAQIEEIDSTQIIGLENVVITGQYSAQSIDKSIYQVEIITSEDIKNQAGNTVADVLSQNLNILIIPNGTTGDSQANILGLGGEYTKILVDNIPIVGDNGMGISIDLTKINLDNVERIEIVKGSMGVDYGNNALAGVINIITKKTNKNKWTINAMLQEETVGKEYDWYEDGGKTKGKGRHIQALEISHNISNNWFISIGVNRNDFQGFWGKRNGKKYFTQDSTRGYEWLPKEQITGNALISYKIKNFNAFYKANYLDEEINFYNQFVEEDNLGGGERTYKAIDRDYGTSRWSHHLNIDTKLFNQIKFIGDFSIQNQDRKFRDYIYDVPNRNVISKNDFKSYMSTDAIYSRGTFSKILNSNWIDFQLGYELDNTKGFISSSAGLFEGNDISKRLESYAGFTSAEIYTNSGLSIRPGFRASFSSKFENQYNFSLSSKYELSSNSNIHAVIGTANRYPDFDELYTYFVDTNHDVRGNENLIPEDGYSTAIQWNHSTKGSKFKMNNNISTMYMNVDDRIELAAINFVPLKYQFINIDKYKSWTVSTDHRFWFNDFNINLGASVLGISRSLFDGVSNLEPEDKFRYTFEANASVNYTFTKLNLGLSLYYKYTGENTEYVLADALSNNPYYRLGKREAFNLMNFSLRKGFLDNNLEITLGARNIFDVSSVRNSILSGDAHSGAPVLQNLFYGRSYFLKINYNLNFN